MTITEKEAMITREVVSAGLKKSAEALSFLMKEDIKAGEMKYSLSPPFDVSAIGNDDSELHVLVTRVIGDVTGICCLIINSTEADAIRNAAIPEEMRNDTELMRSMSDAVLLEFDNIISASVITQFSQLLKAKMHGGVPSLYKMDKWGVKGYIRELMNVNTYIIQFNTRFISSKLNFNPHFLWFFDQSFFNRIRDYALRTEQV